MRFLSRFVMFIVRHRWKVYRRCSSRTSRVVGHRQRDRSKNGDFPLYFDLIYINMSGPPRNIMPNGSRLYTKNSGRRGGDHRAGLGLCNKGFAKMAALVPLTKDQSPLWSSLLALVKALLKRSGFALCFAQTLLSKVWAKFDRSPSECWLGTWNGILSCQNFSLGCREHHAKNRQPRKMMNISEFGPIGKVALERAILYTPLCPHIFTEKHTQTHCVY